MAKYTIYDSSDTSKSVATTPKSHAELYKDGHLEQTHDFSELSLILPDDCLVIAGPPRLRQWSDQSAAHAVGYVQGITIQQTSSVQPLKSIGSRRHIFAKTNQPVSVQINRMLFTGSSLLQTLYYNHSFENGGLQKNELFNAGDSGIDNVANANGHILTNIEEDIYRVPFGIWVHLNSPALMGNDQNGSHAYLIEACTIQSHSMGITAGEAMVMESVSIFADRVVGFQYNSSGSSGSLSSGSDGFVDFSYANGFM